MPDCPDCLVVATNAEELAEEVARLAAIPITIKACSSAEQALADHTDESVVFCDPDLIAEILPEMSTVAWVQYT